jgi:GDPmannose 4,6-dehydratase
MWKMLQQKKPDDYVIATGIQYSIKQFIDLTAKKLNMRIRWKGKGIKEKGIDSNGKIIIECDKNYFRPLDVNTLLGDAKKARKILKWKPKTNISYLIDEMIKSEYESFNVSYKE